MMNVYAVHFDDDRIKVGVTSNTRQRMRYFAQETRRNRGAGFTWFSAGGFDKSGALLAERILCRALADDAMPGHREWSEGTADRYAFVIAAVENLRDAIEPDAPEGSDSWGRFNLTGEIPSMGVVK